GAVRCIAPALCGPPGSAPFPYTALFRSEREEVVVELFRGELTNGLRNLAGRELDRAHFLVAKPPELAALEVLLTIEELHLHGPRSEEHTSELQPREHLVCRLLHHKNNRK